MSTDFDEELYAKRMAIVEKLTREIENEANIDRQMSVTDSPEDMAFKKCDEARLFNIPRIDREYRMNPELEKRLLNSSSVKRKLGLGPFMLFESLIDPKDIELAKERIKHVNDVNFNISGETLVEFCYRHRNLAGIELLIDNGFDLKQLPAELLSKILFLEILVKHEKYYPYLLEAGTNVNIKTSNKRTLLGFALYNDDDKLGQALIDKGAKVSTDTELWYAIMERKFKFAKMLVINGFKIDKLALYWANFESKVSKEGWEFKEFLIDFIEKQNKENNWPWASRIL